VTFRLVRLVSHALASFVIAILAGPQAATAVEEDRYVDRSFGFSFSKPRFTPSEEKGVATVAVTLAGSPVGSFAPNVNVLIQNLETTLDSYKKQQREELKAIGWEVLEQSLGQIGGSPALRTHARGSLQGLEVEFLAIAMIGGETKKKVIVLTCTATSAQFPLYEAEFDRVVTSFGLEPLVSSRM
jgi:hypothetical protein